MFVDELLRERYPEESFITARLSGGDINEVFRATGDHHDFVIKFNSSERFPAMFEKEAEGLHYLAATETIATPEIDQAGELLDKQYLIMSYVEGGFRSVEFWRNFGHHLAALHKSRSGFFGLESSNYIGSLKQVNAPTKSWEEFLITQRFQPMIKMATDAAIIGNNEVRLFEKFMDHIDELWPDEPPALIHGDLWSGNFIPAANNHPVLIDPAVYYGHREMDIGMMHLFGGFDPSLFNAYNETYPLEPGWQDRIPYNQLYPLLVHVNLFGRSYWSSIKEIISPFG